MKTADSPEDKKLQSLLRGARPAPALPPQFEENVWRRVEAVERRGIDNGSGWLTMLAVWLLRPRPALALAVVVMLAGVGLGWHSAQQQERVNAQARYLAAVAPNSLR